MSENKTAIKLNAFIYCKQLTAIDLNPNLQLIQTHTFFGFDQLKIVRFHGSIAQWRTVELHEIKNYSVSSISRLQTLL
jgi:hypothetical protein